MTRPQRGLVVLTFSVLLFWVLHWLAQAQLRAVHFFSGWTLLFLVIALALFNARKKLPFLPLASATSWMQFHIYGGWFAIAVFLFHIGFSVPNGILEASLAFLFVVVALSGVLGLGISKLLPMRLTARGEAILFERIPALRAGLRREVEELVLKSASETKTTTLVDFYADRLIAYFQGPRDLIFHLIDSDRPAHRLLGDLWALERYANPKERELIAQIAERVRLKEDLDYQHAQQWTLKGWLFVHIPLTYCLLVVAALHALLAYGFHGGPR